MSKLEFNRRKKQPVCHPAARLPKGFLAAGLVLFSCALWPATGLAQTFTHTSTGTITFSNGVAAAFPYPSLIYVGTNGAAVVPGTIQTVTVTLQNMIYPVPEDVSFMLVSPNGTAFEIMADVGGTHPIGPFNITITDSASTEFQQTTAFSAGSFKPTSFYCGSGNTNQYPPPAPQPQVSNLAAPCGTSTFASEFTGSNPNGTWQLFAANRLLGPATSLQAWSLNFTVYAPDLSGTCSHTGNFYPGEIGAQYFLVVNNAGPGFSGGGLPVLVADTLPTGLTPTAASGPGWNCVISGQTVTCTETNVAAAGTSYPTITLTVNVALNAPASVINAITLTGSGDGTHIFNDFTAIYPLPTTLMDVDFNTNSLAGGSGGPVLGPTMSGAAVLGNAADRWNGINISSSIGIPLIYANGSNSPVTMTFTSGGGYDVHSYGGTTPFAGTPYDALMEDYLYNGGVPHTITLSGLATNSMYNLILYNAADTAAAGRITYFTVNNNTLSSTWDGASSTLIAGTDYVEFASALSDASGNLAITWTGNGTAEGDIDGFQIQVTPAPQLGISLAGPGSARIFWPGTGNFVLQTNKNLMSASWSNFNGSIITSNGTNSVTMTPPAGNLFFRLKQ